VLLRCELRLGQSTEQRAKEGRLPYLGADRKHGDRRQSRPRTERGGWHGDLHRLGRKDGVVGHLWNDHVERLVVNVREQRREIVGEGHGALPAAATVHGHPLGGTVG
jgi:hypothetical protein